MHLIAYKMTNDSGFAPNPFHGKLTLATCKPGIRSSGNRRIGDWVAGFTSATLCGDTVGSERLVYLMRVDEILPIEDYFLDPRFEAKIPKKAHRTRFTELGTTFTEPLSGRLAMRTTTSRSPTTAIRRNLRLGT